MLEELAGASEAHDTFSAQQLIAEISEATTRARNEAEREIAKAKDATAQAERKAEEIAAEMKAVLERHTANEQKLGQLQSRLSDMQATVRKLEDELASTRSALLRAKDDARTLSAMEKNLTHELEKKLSVSEGRVLELTKRLEEKSKVMKPQVTIPSFRAVPVRNGDGTIREVTLTPGD